MFDEWRFPNRAWLLVQDLREIITTCETPLLGSSMDNTIIKNALMSSRLRLRSSSLDILFRETQLEESGSRSMPTLTDLIMLIQHVIFARMWLLAAPTRASSHSFRALKPGTIPHPSSTSPHGRPQWPKSVSANFRSTRPFRPAGREWQEKAPD